MNGKQRAARAVAARRGELDLTQQELAAAAGIDTKTIGNLERRGRWPIARTRARIEKALNWAPGELDHIAQEEPEPKPALSEQTQAKMRAELGDELAARLIAHAEHLASGRTSEEEDARPPAADGRDRRPAG